MSVAVPSVTSKVGTIEATQLHDLSAGPNEHLRGLVDYSCTFHFLALARTMISFAASAVSFLCKGWSTDQPFLSMKNTTCRRSPYRQLEEGRRQISDAPKHRRHRRTVIILRSISRHRAGEIYINRELSFSHSPLAIL
jgi:hypothetical protein